MPKQRKAAQNIDRDFYRVAELLEHHLVQRQFFARPELAKAVRNPEIRRVHDQKQQNQCAEQRHAATVPSHSRCGFRIRISHRTRVAVLFPQVQSLENMDQESENQHDFERSDDWVRAHEVCSDVERFSSVVIKNQPVDRRVHDQETDQEQPRERHRDFLSERTREKLQNPFHKIRFDCKKRHAPDDARTCQKRKIMLQERPDVLRRSLRIR